MNWRHRGVSLRALGRLQDEVQAVLEAHPCPEVRRWAAICCCEIDQVLLRVFWLDAALDHHRAGEGG